jgi:lactate dehydrogenase-like 2-hydroxyacid dehydrogenase
VDEKALAAALGKGQIAGAALDRPPNLYNAEVWR